MRSASASPVPPWGKDKLAVLLHRQQHPVSVSMVGRILRQLKQQGRLIEPSRSGVPGSRRALRSRPYAIRKPKQPRCIPAAGLTSKKGMKLSTIYWTSTFEQSVLMERLSHESRKVVSLAKEAAASS
jgi:hypothetical protein